MTRKTQPIYSASDTCFTTSLAQLDTSRPGWLASQVLLDGWASVKSISLKMFVALGKQILFIRTIKALSALDDHTLKDIGIHRCGIYSVSRQMADDWAKKF